MRGWLGNLFAARGWWTTPSLRPNPRCKPLREGRHMSTIVPAAVSDHPDDPSPEAIARNRAKRVAECLAG